MESIKNISLEDRNDSTRLLKNSASLAPQTAHRLLFLKAALSKMGLLRGEVMDSVRLESYSKALVEEFRDDQDILSTLDRMVKSRRGEYEAKIPDMGDLIWMVKEERTARQKATREAQDRIEEEARWKHRREHPEAYVSMGELLAEVNERIAAKKSAESKIAAPSATPNGLVSQETLDRIAKVKSELEYSR